MLLSSCNWGLPADGGCQAQGTMHAQALISCFKQRAVLIALQLGQQYVMDQGLAFPAECCVHGSQRHAPWARPQNM